MIIRRRLIVPFLTHGGGVLMIALATTPPIFQRRAVLFPINLDRRVIDFVDTVRNRGYQSAVFAARRVPSWAYAYRCPILHGDMTADEIAEEMGCEHIEEVCLVTMCTTSRTLLDTAARLGMLIYPQDVVLDLETFIEELRSR